MSSALSASSRTVVLAMVALGLLAIVILRQAPISLPEFQSTESVLARIDYLRRLSASREQIGRVYGDVVAGYAMRMAALDTLMPHGGDPKTFLEQLIRKELAAVEPSGAASLVLGQPAAVADKVTRIPFDVSFTSGDSAGTLAAIEKFGQAERGMVWETLVVTADPAKKTVTVSGRVAALVVEAAE